MGQEPTCNAPPSPQSRTGRAPHWVNTGCVSGTGKPPPPPGLAARSGHPEVEVKARTRGVTPSQRHRGFCQGRIPRAKSGQHFCRDTRFAFRTRSRGPAPAKDARSTTTLP